MGPRVFNKGDIVYCVRGVNPVQGEVFDRIGVIITRVKEVKQWEYCGINYYVDNDNELLPNSFTNLEDAKEEAKILMQEKPQYKKYANDPIYIINKLDKEIKNPKIQVYSKLSIFDFLEEV